MKFMIRLLGRREGAVGVIAAVVLPLLIGTTGLVIEYGHGLLEKIENQRIADLGAYAGAIAYNSVGTEAAMTSAARAVAALNGITNAGVSVALVASPVGTPSTNAVRVTITTKVPLIFSRLFGSAPMLPVPAEAYAELRPLVDSCILALSATGTGVTLTGGTALNAPACSVASNTSISVPCGTTMRTVGVSYNSAAAPSAPCGGIVGPTGGAATIIKKATPDPLRENASIAAARARLTTVAALVAPGIAGAPAAPIVTSPGGAFSDITFDRWANEGNTTRAQAIAVGCTASNTNDNWRFTCGAGSHRINALSVAGGQSVAFVGTTSTNYYFAQKMDTGPTINFGNGNFVFLQGLNIGYGGATFGAGTLAVAGNLNTGASGGFATFGSTNISVTGDATLTATTTLSGTGTLAVGGRLTVSANPVIAHSAISVTGQFNVTTTVAFDGLTSLRVGGLTSLGTSGNMRFAGGAYTLTGGLETGGSTVVTMGAGTYNVGRMASTCSGAQFSICSNAASLIIAGPSVFNLTSGVAAGGGTTLVLGSSGTDNSFNIGAATNGNAIQVGGGAVFRMGDATGVSSVFELGGHLNVASGGGSCTVVAAALQHDIKGSIITAGATVLGAGVYTVYGSVGIGSNGGGNVMCNGANVGLLANNVSLIIGANGTGLTGACNEQAFCVAAGYQNVVLTAPSAGNYRRLAVVGPAVSTRGVFFTEGAGGTTLSGLLYSPVGTVRLDGGAAVGNGTGECLQVVGKEVALNGGSLLATTCISGSAAGGKVVLVR